MEGKPDYRLIEESITMLWDEHLGWWNSCRNLTIKSDAQLGWLTDIKWMLKKRNVIMVRASLRDTADEAEDDDALGNGDSSGGGDDDDDDDNDRDDSHCVDENENRENDAASTSGKDIKQQARSRHARGKKRAEPDDNLREVVCIKTNSLKHSSMKLICLPSIIGLKRSIPQLKFCRMLECE